MDANRCLEGKVIVITGAGRGIGREIALLAGAQGASVVVNDLGVSATGAGADASPADEVVAEIIAGGGKAVANPDNVADWDGAQRIIATAIDNFGRIDSVVNNAGILRDSIFHRLSPEDFDKVVKVHLYGSFHVARAAAPYFREQQSGSYVHFASASGLIGNFGQANYAAAKLGVAGLSKSIALDMAKFGVRSNCIVPFAWSRLIGTLPENTEEERQRVARFKSMGPEKIAPLTVFLASELARDVTGQIFAARRNEVFLMSQPRPIRSMHRAEGWTPATLAEQMLPAFKPDFYGLDKSADVFSWDPI
ncbi:MAG: SDR family oxidoreductase [Alphaproteobacteria bacterium]|nr:SDR family oxidoreductase [Alphaproteobacteria bacterium]